MIGIENYDAVVFLNGVPGWYTYPWDMGLNDNRIILRLNTFISFLSTGNPFVHALFFCFFSMTGIIQVLKVSATYLSKSAIQIAMYGMLFLPGLLCWTSVISKESWAVFLIGMLLFSIQKLFSNRQRIKGVIFLLLILLLFIYSKAYLLIILIPSLISWTICHFKKTKRTPLVFFTTHIIAVFIVVVSGMINPYLNPTWIVYQKQANFIKFSADADPRTKFELQELQPNYKSFLSNIPEALINPIVHPSPTELKNKLLIPFFLENIILVLLFAFLLYQRNINVQNPMNWMALYFFVGVFLLIGMTIPITGLLIRLKVPAILLLCLLFAESLSRNQQFRTGISGDKT
ncbi:MAG: hypothetical protein IPP38_18140 [Bacteroidetes bacterium]|nr:hypothetical protein [Bacteroidota bacterium]